MFKSQEKLILEIHNEFDTAQERLLSQAHDLLSKIEIEKESRIEDVAERLKNIGFTATPTVKIASEIKNDREQKKKVVVETAEMARLIQHYKYTYPFLKFLTEEELDRICDKYNLIHAPVGNYIKDVPEKNIRDIETAQKLREGDKLETLLYFVAERAKNQSHLDETIRLLGFKNGEFTQTNFEAAIRNSKHHTEVHSIPELYIKRGYTDSTWLYLISEYDLGRRRVRDWNYYKVHITNKDGLFIAAPPSHFNLNGLSKKSKHGFFKVFETEVKDPIVFRYVKGGIQVITKWGLEANDPSLVVETLN